MLRTMRENVAASLQMLDSKGAGGSNAEPSSVTEKSAAMEPPASPVDSFDDDIPF